VGGLQILDCVIEYLIKWRYFKCNPRVTNILLKTREIKFVFRYLKQNHEQRVFTYKVVVIKLLSYHGMASPQVQADKTARKLWIVAVSMQ